MKKVLIMLTAVIALCGCANKADNSNASAEESGNKCVDRLPSGIDMDNLKDANVVAEFTIDDFDWEKNTLTFGVYAETLFDAADIHNLAEGDTITGASEEEPRIIVKTITKENDYIMINGGLYEGGLDIQSHEGGTYRLTTDDDHSVYYEIGTITLPLAKDFTIVDCEVDPAAPSINVTSNQKAYIEGLKDNGNPDFICLDTDILIENGVITKITRHWIP